MYLSHITIQNFRCLKFFECSLKQGLTALIGENDSGKTAVIDALRFVLGTRDQEGYRRLDDSDFYGGTPSVPITIVCKFEDLTTQDRKAFVQYLTYSDKKEDKPLLYLNWTAKDTGELVRGRPYRRVDVRSGKNGDGPPVATEARELLRATYLRPLRDAEQALSAGRGSRLSQVLHHTEQITAAGVGYDPKVDVDPKTLNVLGIGDLANALLEKQKGIEDTRSKIDAHLGGLSLRGSTLRSSIKVSGATASPDARLRQLLEKLELILGGSGKLGLGSNNLLFMACELLLLAQEDEGNKLLLIEEPEAHLHTQRQLRVMASLEEQAKEKGIQIIVTTHSPNLASAIKLDNMVMIHNGRAFSLAKEETKLDHSDYKFLERFLDVTKANLLFARGVVIVEGDAENILLPTLANLIGRDFTEHGVSIVNVGGVGLRRYARIFQRTNPAPPLDIPVACVTDMDVMPDCAPVIVGKTKEGEWSDLNSRRWRAKKDFTESDLAAQRTKKHSKVSGQSVQSFVSDEWTLEFDLALGPKDKTNGFLGGMAEDVYVAACLADKDENINAKQIDLAAVETTAKQEFAVLKEAVVAKDGCTVDEVLASHVYAKFAKDGASKAIAAQYLAERLQTQKREGTIIAEDLRKRLPKYLVEAIDYVTSRDPAGSDEKLAI